MWIIRRTRTPASLLLAHRPVILSVPCRGFLLFFLFLLHHPPCGTNAVPLSNRHSSSSSSQHPDHHATGTLAELITARLRGRLSGAGPAGDAQRGGGCAIATRLTVQAEVEPRGTAQAEALLLASQVILKQFAGDAGVFGNGRIPILAPRVSMSAVLREPYRLQFVEDADDHFFSDLDGRITYKVLGAPGGDVGEFIAALLVLDKARPDYLTAEMVLELFQERLSQFTRDKFHYQTDVVAVRRWGEATQVEHPLAPTQPEEISKLVSESSEYDHVGSPHLRGLLVEPKYAGIAAAVIEAFFTVYFDTSHPLRPLLLVSTLDGPRRKDTGVVIIATGTKTAVVGATPGCAQAAPLVRPNNGKTRMMVYHRTAAQLRRKNLASFIATKHPAGEDGASVLFNAIDDLAEKLFRHTMATEFPGSRMFLGTWHVAGDE
mgnify:CR=1 FL=1|jgi:hypothetical protein